MAKFQPVGRGVIVTTEDGKHLGTAPHGMDSTDALAAIGYVEDEHGRLSRITPPGDPSLAAAAAIGGAGEALFGGAGAEAPSPSHPLDVLTVAELRARAEKAQIAGFKRMSKPQLVAALAAL